MLIYQFKPMRNSGSSADLPQLSMAALRMSILGTVVCCTSSTLCGTGLNRHIGYEASVLHSKPSDNFGEVTITGLASVDQRLARNRYFIYESICSRHQ